MRCEFVGHNNLGNMTALPGQAATQGGDTDGAGNPITQRFRNFRSLDELADAYASWVERRAPDAVGAADAQAYADALRRGNYATSPLFSRSLSGVARRFERGDAGVTPKDLGLLRSARDGPACVR